MMRSLKMLFMRAENVLGEFANPKNITFGSNSPQLVTKADFHSSTVLTWLEVGHYWQVMIDEV